MIVRALHVTTDQQCAWFEYDPHKALDELRERVGGWIELVPIADRTVTMYCNEEGKIHGLPVNITATLLLESGNPDVIVGDVVITGPEDKLGYDTSLSEKWVKENLGEVV